MYLVRRILKSDYLPRPFSGNFMQAQKALRDWDSVRGTPWEVVHVPGTPFPSVRVGLYATRSAAYADASRLNDLEEERLRVEMSSPPVPMTEPYGV